MRRPNDRSRVVIETGFGLGTWAIKWASIWFFVFLLVVIVGSYPWLLLLLLIPAFLITRSEIRRVRYQKKIHRAKYGRDPRPW